MTLPVPYGAALGRSMSESHIQRFTTMKYLWRSHDLLVEDIKMGKLQIAIDKNVRSIYDEPTHKSGHRTSAPLFGSSVTGRNWSNVGAIGWTENELDKDTKELIYRHLDKAFNSVILPQEQREKVLENYGILSHDLKVEMLQKWMENQKGNLKEATKTLEDRMRKTFESEIEIGTGIVGEHLCSHVVESIEDDHWLRFARLCLQFSDKEINEFLHKCEFTEEQKFQIVRSYGRREITKLMN